MTEFGSSWLVQRLEKPRNWGGTPFIDNPFSFGGGLKNGGLSDQAMGLIRDIWSFDYMGAAEFEFGAVPKALEHIAEATLEAWTTDIPLSEVPANWRDKTKTKPTGHATIYVLGPYEWKSQITERIREFATENYSLKEHTGLAAALRPVEDYDREKCGWLELDNGFLFFTDKEMWEKASTLFGVATEAVAAWT